MGKKFKGQYNSQIIFFLTDFLSLMKMYRYNNKDGTLVCLKKKNNKKFHRKAVQY